MLSLDAKIREELIHLPTEDQARAIKAFDYHLNDATKGILVLKGFAGTGKSTLVAAYSRSLKFFKYKTVLLAPTGRAAKVLSTYSGQSAHTIHRKIYFALMTPEGGVALTLGENKHKNTIFIVDEASMISAKTSDAEFSSHNLLDDLMEYVEGGENCRLIFVGDTAQLPPIGSELSPALNTDYLKNRYSKSFYEVVLKQVVRQQNESRILYNATQLRINVFQNQIVFPKIEIAKDVIRLSGDMLEDALNESYRKYGFENVLVITRSNKRANAFNQQIRFKIKWQENEISAGDLIMIVKNNYYWLEKESKTGFIANGDTAEVIKVLRKKEIRGFQYSELILRFIDYPEIGELCLWVLLNTLQSETPNLSYPEMIRMSAAIEQEFYAEIPNARQRLNRVKEDPFYNALQIKFSYAVTCHKSQGGQWPCVFIDAGYFTEDMLSREYLRWLYTAFTRGTVQLYLIQFNEKFFPSL
jgi:exodeoxyribonuclease-5